VKEIEMNGMEKGESCVLGKSFPRQRLAFASVAILRFFAFIQGLLNQTTRFYPAFGCKNLLFRAIYPHFQPFFTSLLKDLSHKIKELDRFIGQKYADPHPPLYRETVKL
jgi:hypothetical protein